MTTTVLRKPRLSAAEQAFERLRSRSTQYRSVHRDAHLRQVDTLEEEGRFFLIAIFSNDAEVIEDYEPEIGTRLPRIKVVSQQMVMC